MIYHLREMNYTENYQEFFQALTDLKELVEKKHPEVHVTLMYNLDGVRGKAQVFTSYPSMDAFEKIGDQLDNDEDVVGLTMKLLENADRNHLFVDHFFRGI